MPAFQFRVPPHNAHYEGDYTPEMIAWRQAGAIDKANHIKAMLGSRASEVESVLEVGCGTGAVLAEVVKLGIGSRHVGVDAANPAEHADPQARELELELLCSTEERLPFADGSFDLVYASHVLEHVQDERGFLAELKRVSKGYVFVEVPCELVLRSSGAALQKTLNIGHINAYTKESFVLKLATSGLDVLDARLFDHSEKVHSFFGGPIKGQIKMALRRAVLKSGERVAGKIFCYHCGALCR